MPKITSIGTPSEANKLIGGVPTIYYYDFASKGRGEVLRLFFEEAGIAFVDHRWSFAEHNDGMTIEERALINPTGSVPYLDINGKIYGQSYAILRHFSALLGKYDGKDLEERYRVDMMNDQCADWRSLFVGTAFVNDTKGLYANADASPFAFHKSFNLPKYVKAIEAHLTKSPYLAKGPFILGSDISYADIVLFQICHDEREVGDGITVLLDTIAPNLKALLAGVCARPNIAAYFASDRYYN